MKTRRILGAPLRGLKRLNRMLFSRGAGLVWRILPRTRFDYGREVGDGMGSSLIMAPIGWIARNFPEAPPRVLDAEGTPVEPHELIRRLRRPNPYYSGIVLWMATITSWILDGNAYWVKVRNQLGGVLELWYVPHWLIEPKATRDRTGETFITHYEYTVDGRVIPLEITDVVHFRYGLDPKNPRKGLSPLGSVLREVFTDDEAANFSASLLRNLGVPGLIVSPAAGAEIPSAEDVAATKDYLKEAHTGDRRGEPLVMSGPTEITQFGFSPEQLTLRELRRIPEERVTAVIGLPAIVCGLGAGLDRSTFANFAEAREAAWEESIIPMQRMFAEELRHQLLPDFEDNADAHEIDFDRTNVRVLQEDRNREAQRLGQLYRDGIITRAEARGEVGLETEPADEVFAVPFSTLLTPRGAPPMDYSRELPAAPETGGEQATQDDEEGEPEQRAAGDRRRKLSAADQRQLVLALQRDERVLAAAFAGELERDFQGLGDRAAEIFLELAGDLGVAGRENGATKADDDTIADRVLAALAVGEWVDGTLRARFEAHWRRVANRTVETINATLDLGVDLPDEVARRLIHQGGTRRGLLDVAESTRNALMRSIAEGRAAGDGPIEIARRIRAQVPAGRYVNAGPKYRAELIARTETKYAQNASSIATYRAAPNVTHVIALDARLGDSDPDCEARDGQIFTFDEAEAELAQEHPNGTLSFAPVVAESMRELEGAAA